MNEHLIHFKDIEWESPVLGMKQKIFHFENKSLRLVRFETGFVENDWCEKAHIGYVLLGEMKINFNGNFQKFVSGDGFYIQSGETEKHKVVIDEGKFVEIILFEII